MANKNIKDTFYGGSNQIARLPYKTIDALQQIGLYVEPDPNDSTCLNVKSETQEISPSKTVDLAVDVNNGQVVTQNLTVNGYMYLPFKGGESDTYPIWDLFTRIVDTNINISAGDKLSKETINSIKGFKEPYILTGTDHTILLMTDPSGLNGLYIKADGKIMSWAEINAITGAITIKAAEEKHQYVHMMKIVSTAGDTCYLTAISPMAKRSLHNYLTVKLYIAGGLSTAEGTLVGNMVGQYSCNGYNSTLNKSIVALDLGENKFIYSDGTTSTEALSSSNTTVTAEVYGQSNK